MNKRYCPDCKKEKKNSEFSIRDKKRKYLNSRCKDCMVVRSKKWIRKNREKFNNYQRKWRTKNQESRVSQVE